MSYSSFVRSRYHWCVDSFWDSSVGSTAVVSVALTVSGHVGTVGAFASAGSHRTLSVSTVHVPTGILF